MSHPSRLAIFVAGLVVGGALTIGSPVRRIGDGAEYLAMAQAFAHGHRPSLTPEQLLAAGRQLANDPVDLRFPALVGADGRQDFPHFWFYSLLAAPFVGFADALGVSPLRGFEILNLLLWAVAIAVASRHATPATLAFIFLGPIIWWLDKGHTEVFTVSLVGVALVSIDSAPWLSAVAFGAAATQNPPWLVGALLAAGLTVHDRGWRDRRIWLAGAGLALAALPAVYGEVRLGAWSELARGGYIDRHVPTFVAEWTTHLIDPNLGLFTNDPLLLVAVLIGLVAWRVRWPRSSVVTLVLGLVCVTAFTQSTNQNGGGTPSMSRYALWLLPLTMPFLEAAHARARTIINALAGAAAVWCVVMFLPARAEHPLEPTALASTVWSSAPSLNNPLAEVFVKRVAGNPTATPAFPVATTDCGKALTLGAGAATEWPARCGSATIPDACRTVDAECYANRSGAGYRFVTAPTQPGWQRQVARLRGPHRPWTPPLEEQTDDVTAFLVDGWFTPGDPYTWIGETAHVGLDVARAGTFAASFTALAHDHPRRLLVTIDGRTVAEVTAISTTVGATVFPLGALSPGLHRLRFESLDGADTGSSADPRRLSVAVESLQIARVSDRQ